MRARASLSPCLVRRPPDLAPRPPPAASKFASVYETAREVGFPRLTMHSGEEGPASWVRQTVFDLGINRVDHGVHAADDDALLDELAARETFFTLCPLSNVRLRVHKSVSESPIPKFLAKNIKFSLNSDDPAYFGGASLFLCVSHFAPRRREARADAARTPFFCRLRPRQLPRRARRVPVRQGDVAAHRAERHRRLVVLGRAQGSHVGAARGGPRRVGGQGDLSARARDGAVELD